jgi:integrase
MSTGKLTAVAVKNAKPADRPYKLSDGGGMFLLVNAVGKYWRLAYRFAGKQKMLALGPYPEVTLEAARKARDAARQLLRDGTDPGMVRKVDKLTARHKSENTFEAVAREWHGKYKATWTEHTANKNIRILEINVFPWLGSRPIGDVTTPELLAVIRRVEERGLLDTAHRLRHTTGQVFRYGIATGRCERDLSADLRGAITPLRKQNMAAIVDPVAFGKLLRDIWAYKGALVTCCAFRLSVLFGLRPGEIRALEWGEVDTENRLIRIPMGKMKARRLHVVPLAPQALAILEELRPLTGGGRYCFPGMQNRDRPMSENTINAALRRMGYDTRSEHTAHGFRSSFSTMAHGSGLFRAEVVEVQLAHKHGDPTRLAYDRGDFLEERRKLMAWWADQCDQMRQGAEVIPLHGEAA